VIRYLSFRALGSIPVLLLITMLVFGMLHLAPGDPASVLLPEDTTDEERIILRARWGLDDPFPVQYVRFVTNLATGDFGRSFRFSEPVLDVITVRLPATMELASAALLVSLALALPLGIAGGWRPNSIWDTGGSILGLLGVSSPAFWLGIMLILVLSGWAQLFPSAGRSSYGIAGEQITGFYVLDSLLTLNAAAVADALRYMVLPALTLGMGLAGIVMRITRSSVLDVRREDFVTTARAKGLMERNVLLRHALGNALIPVITMVGLELGALLSGSIIVEAVFAWPGVGTLLLQGISARDYPLVTGIVMIYTVGFMLINLLVDVLYAVVDPRIRY
jgi:peptide/nickel transport system permease protein